MATANTKYPQDAVVRLTTASGSGNYFAQICTRRECEWVEGDWVVDVIENGPEFGNALGPADVQASRWAESIGLQYIG